MTTGTESQLNHVAIIMDGNGRWAKQKHKIRLFGHRAGLKSVRRTIKVANQQGIKCLTLYAFSSENWNRPQEEVSGLISLFIYALEKEAAALHKNNIRLKIIGDISQFPQKLQDRIRRVEEQTQNNNALFLNIAANYGGRWDITQACQKLISKVEQGILTKEQITEARFSEEIALHDMPPVDLVIRTGGECRISNFLLWQVAYAELFFTDILWPDFDESEFERAIESFHSRERRFGKV